MLDVWLKGNISPSAELFYEDLNEADNIEVIRKLLDINLRKSFSQKVAWSIVRGMVLLVSTITPIPAVV